MCSFFNHIHEWTTILFDDYLFVKFYIRYKICTVYEYNTVSVGASCININIYHILIQLFWLRFLLHYILFLFILLLKHEEGRENKPLAARPFSFSNSLFSTRSCIIFHYSSISSLYFQNDKFHDLLTNFICLL